MLWDGDKPSQEEFAEYAAIMYGVTGNLEVDDPTVFRGMLNPGTATVTPNAPSQALAASRPVALELEPIVGFDGDDNG